EGMSVLIVDDNATNRRVLRDLLINWRMKPTTVASGREALATLRQGIESDQPFPLVLLDGHMPEMDGFQLAEHIRNIQALREVTLLMLTSAGMPEDVVRCKNLGIRAYLTKPVKQSELFDTIVLALSGAGWQPESAPETPL